MLSDQTRDPGARARATGAGNAMGYIIGAVLIAGIIAMVAMFAFGDQTSTDTTVATPPASTAPVTQQRTTPPPTNTTTTTPTQPSIK